MNGVGADAKAGPERAKSSDFSVSLRAGSYLQPGVSVVCPGGWHLPTDGPEFPAPPPLLPGPKAGSPNAGAASTEIPSAAPRTTAVILFRMSHLPMWFLRWLLARRTL